MNNQPNKSNRLSKEKSPYLLQHAENPVDWYPWGEEAFSEAVRKDKPVFLSIGYSTCHWCHVMAHESFENQDTANILNEHFISIKVDREERPDVDSVYMAACQAFTGSGGWPTTIFMTPQQEPFFAGTYFPPQSRYGMVAFPELLLAIAQQWQQNRAELVQSAKQMVEHLKPAAVTQGEPDAALTANAARMYFQSFDAKHGGFGREPKFPTPHNLLFLLAYGQIQEDPSCTEMVKKTLTQMRKGGIFDHIGYGFSRYSTDRIFLVPHFEKMLYDNALLTLAYAATYGVTKEALYLDTAEKVVAYVLREMTSADGGFYSAQDADSDGIEGKYYVFAYDEILSVLGKEAGEQFSKDFGITKQGNFEGKNIPNRLHADDARAEVPAALYEYRRKREKLHLDDKILTAWNALMISALAYLYRVTGKESYLLAAKQAQGFIEAHLRDGDTLFVSYRNGVRSQSGFLDDYAFYAAALLTLYEATLEEKYLLDAERLCCAASAFIDTENGGYYLSGKQNERLILSTKEVYDGAMPSGNAVMAYNLVRLSQLLQDPKWEEAAKAQLGYLSGVSKDYPAGHGMFMLALLMHLNPPPIINVVLASLEDKDMVKQRVPLYASVRIQPISQAYQLLNDKTTFYVCQNNTCFPPTNTI